MHGMIKRLLMVCIGNVCRSPMAVGVMQNMFPDFQTSSAGLDALVGSPADELAVALMNERGIEIGSHRARQISRSIALEADLILVMDRQQQKQLEQLYPETKGRVFRLGQWIDEDIPDPFRLPRAEFD